MGLRAVNEKGQHWMLLFDVNICGCTYTPEALDSDIGCGDEDHGRVCL